MMDTVINPILLDYIVCPDCKGGLIIRDKELNCSLCGNHFKVTNGIPYLLPKETDSAHFEEETNLAKMMKNKSQTKKDVFSSQQWSLFKEEFWNTVEKETTKNRTSFINIGCGYDFHFKKISNPDNVFINFDLIPEMLTNLTEEHSARYCVLGDINSLPFKKDILDYVVCIDVIHHEYQRISSILHEYFGLLKPGGKLFLADPNAWGLFQFYKSILLPKPVHGFLREQFHRIKKSDHRPAEYEFPTNVFEVRNILSNIGFEEITAYPINSYPNVDEAKHKIYKYFQKNTHIATYHNFHYVISARKPVN